MRECIVCERLLLVRDRCSRSCAPCRHRQKQAAQMRQKRTRTNKGMRYLTFRRMLEEITT